VNVEGRGDRRRFRRLSFLTLIVCVCAAASARAAGEYRTVEIESLRITFDSEWAVRTAPGYLPVRFDITNLGEARVIEIVGRGTRFSRAVRRVQLGGVDVRQVVRLARGDRVRLTLPVPAFADNETIGFEIREGNRTLERFGHSTFMSKNAPANASALIVADPASAFGKLAAGWPRTITGPTGPIVTTAPATTGPAGGVASSARTLPPLDFTLDPSRLPTNWLGFTSLRAVVIGPTEWEQLNADQKSAILTWSACGGDLMFVDGEPGALFPSGQSSLARGSERTVRGYFFGRIHFPTSASVAAAGLGTVLTAAETLQDPNWALPANRASDWGIIGARGFRLPIPGVDGVPARAYLSILIIFTLLIGPINYWLLWRKRRQVLLVLTAPLISLIFIVLLAGYVVAGEGVGVRARAATFTMLDQVRQQASTRASLSLYAAGMTPAGGLRFARDAAVFTIGPDGTGSLERQTLDLTDAQRFTTGVIHARSPTNLEQIAFRPARERLNFSRDASGMSVINGLGATVSRLLYRDGDTIYTLAGPLPAGGKGILTIGVLDAGNVVPSDVPLSGRFRHLLANQPAGSYLAVLERSPFWDPGISGVAERGSFHLVIGWPGGQP
jgi:hypothetical protein